MPFASCLLLHAFCFLHFALCLLLYACPSVCLSVCLYVCLCQCLVIPIHYNKYLVIWAEEIRHGKADGGDEDQHGAHAEPKRASPLSAEVRDEWDHA